mgnify:CR=1 FL=1
MKLTGIADEAGETVDAQIDATNALGWKHIEARFVKVDGFEKGSIHEIPEEALRSSREGVGEARIESVFVGCGACAGDFEEHVAFFREFDPGDDGSGRVDG